MAGDATAMKGERRSGDAAADGAVEPQMEGERWAHGNLDAPPLLNNRDLVPPMKPQSLKPPHMANPQTCDCDKMLEESPLL
ncbi:hypothetical protein Dsin_028614 [Dipteronia sinensis]|uniref:Uncharacterized protein n=1 Tax=Dipteronia sinensis TaxID=43782 RepID=A0AAE0DUF3_9ROSI|nr:hypothetical protein Dsin_028614 [Dipteronia sinensis]